MRLCIILSLINLRQVNCLALGCWQRQISVSSFSCKKDDSTFLERSNKKVEVQDFSKQGCSVQLKSPMKIFIQLGSKKRLKCLKNLQRSLLELGEYTLIMLTNLSSTSKRVFKILPEKTLLDFEYLTVMPDVLSMSVATPR